MTLLRRLIRILLYGKDARTDAIAATLLRSGWEVELVAYTEFKSPGLVARCARVQRGRLDVSVEALKEMTAFAGAVKPDLVIVGPEEPLAAGLSNAVRALGIPCFGPLEELAHIETSKAWARRLLDTYGIPGNPEYRIFERPEGLMQYLRELGTFVVKPDGLTGGKGVRVAGEHLADVNEAHEYALSVIAKHGRVLIEERLEGEEFSLQSITDGETVVHCPVVQDHKRAYPGDTGPNTGGMGSYSCPDGSLPFLAKGDLDAARRTNELVVEAIRAKTGEPYQGVLYGGFMVTRDGVRLIEYNARFGDPEAMNVLPLLRSDFVDICLAVTRGTLSKTPVVFDQLATVCKYLVPKGYPNSKKDAGEVIFVPRVEQPGLHCYWAATEMGDLPGEARLTGSRALAFVGVGDTLAEAEKIAESGAGSVTGKEVRYRSDIGTAAALQARIQHMRELCNKTGSAGSISQAASASEALGVSSALFDG